MNLRNLILACTLLSLTTSHSPGQETESTKANQADSRVSLEQHENRITVQADGELFTEYIFKGYEKPILYPIIGPHGIGMTRNWPMKEGVKTEAKDHPHHKSIWFGHMKVNDESFWHSGKNAGTTRQTELVSATGNTIKTKNKLVRRDGETVVATDSRTIQFSTDEDVRMIDYEVTYHATEGDILFGDNKDGQMGIRMHPALRVKGDVANGQAINSAGDTTKNIWGKRAAWIAYWGKVDDKVVGIAVCDHPTNLRHPTWWHARDYGLLSANPFGIHHFENKKDHVGEFTLKKGDSLTFRHLFIFHPGDYQNGKVDQRFKKWVSSSSESAYAPK
ncbi:MAG: PmoA family protein [Planctomycetota bacterium]